MMTLWRPALRRAFPHRMPLTRKQAHRPLNAPRQLRNRIAHHEPIFARPLLEDHQRILEVAGWISPAAQSWIKHHSCVPMPPAAAELVPCPRTEASRRSGTGAAATDRGSRTGRGRSHAPAGTGRPEHAQQIAGETHRFDTTTAAGRLVFGILRRASARQRLRGARDP